MRTLHTDGGARGNPGIAAYAFILQDAKGTIADGGRCIGVATSNVAEYSALVHGLAVCLDVGLEDVQVESDSELLVRQMTGVYAVRSPAILDLHREASRLVQRAGTVHFSHVKRGKNEQADSLYNSILNASSPSVQYESDNRGQIFSAQVGDDTWLNTGIVLPKFSSRVDISPEELMDEIDIVYKPLQGRDAQPRRSLL